MTVLNIQYKDFAFNPLVLKYKMLDELFELSNKEVMDNFFYVHLLNVENKLDVLLEHNADFNFHRFNVNFLEEVSHIMNEERENHLLKTLLDNLLSIPKNKRKAIINNEVVFELLCKFVLNPIEYKRVPTDEHFDSLVKFVKEEFDSFKEILTMCFNLLPKETVAFANKFAHEAFGANKFEFSMKKNPKLKNKVMLYCQKNSLKINQDSLDRIKQFEEDLANLTHEDFEEKYGKA